MRMGGFHNKITIYKITYKYVVYSYRLGTVPFVLHLLSENENTVGVGIIISRRLSSYYVYNRHYTTCHIQGRSTYNVPIPARRQPPRMTYSSR